MTTETVHKIELSDVARVTYECKDCGARISLPLGSWDTQFKCPRCGVAWAPTDTAAHKAVFALMQGFRELIERKGELKFSLSFEVPPPPE